MSSDSKSKNAKKKPFKWTKELVRMAINDGWTQSEIADKCRTQQSIVSAWRKGTKYGSEQQLKPLLNIYGYKLRRNTFRLYWSLDPETKEKRFYKVEGKVIFSEVLYRPEKDHSGKISKQLAVEKIIIHHQGESQFKIVIQNRMHCNVNNQILALNSDGDQWNSNPPLHCDNVGGLLNWADNMSEKIMERYPAEGMVLPFKIRKAFLNQGIPVDGIEEFTIPW